MSTYIDVYVLKSYIYNRKTSSELKFLIVYMEMEMQMVNIHNFRLVCSEKQEANLRHTRLRNSQAKETTCYIISSIWTLQTLQNKKQITTCQKLVMKEERWLPKHRRMIEIHNDWHFYIKWISIKLLELKNIKSCKNLTQLQAFLWRYNNAKRKILLAVFFSVSEYAMKSTFWII